MFVKRNKRHAKTPVCFASELRGLLFIGSLFEVEQRLLR
jgi:hypothetical protein